MHLSQALSTYSPLCRQNKCYKTFGKSRISGMDDIYIKVDHHFICEYYVDDIITIPHVSPQQRWFVNQQKIVDLFIKAISCDHYNLLVSKLILCNDLHQFEGECEESTNHSVPVEYEISTNLTLSRWLSVFFYFFW